MRKYTEEKAASLGLVGWARNVIPDGTVEGAVEGHKDKIHTMFASLPDLDSISLVICFYQF